MFFQKPKDFLKLFLDMDSFFASVEQQVNPPLRKIPVAVAPYIGQTGCVISSSKKAKEYGVKTGTSVGEAKKLYPKIKILGSRPLLYHLYHREIVKVLASFSPFLKILSIDEMTILLEDYEQNKKATREIAFKIKQKIKEKVGDFLTCSIGVGPNQFLAKVAAESKKPDGFSLVTLTGLEDFYRKFKLLDLPGINTQMETALNHYGIKSPLAFYQASQDDLTHFGHIGKVWHLRLHGYEVDDFLTQTVSIGHSFVLPPKYRSQEGAKRVVTKLASKVGYRLRKEKFFARGLSLSIRFLGGGGFRKFTKAPPFSDNHTLINQALYLFSFCHFPNPPLAIYLVALDLSKGKRQPSLFEEVEKMSRLSEAIDKINDQYGVGTIFSAGMQNTDDAAPDRIPYGRPRYEIKF